MRHAVQDCRGMYGGVYGWCKVVGACVAMCVCGHCGARLWMLVPISMRKALSMFVDVDM